MHVYVLSLYCHANIVHADCVPVTMNLTSNRNAFDILYLIRYLNKYIVQTDDTFLSVHVLLKINK